jgi:hypothetical protein
MEVCMDDTVECIQKDKEMQPGDRIKDTTLEKRGS